jgi:hypothetical protein
MGAFIIFPVLLFSVFITAVLGFTDFVHVSTLVHAAAQNAVQAAAEVPPTAGSQSAFVGGGSDLSNGSGWQGVALDASSVNTTVGAMMNGQPYITGYSCSTSGAIVSCIIHFKVDMPILGYVNATTSASSSNVATGG